MIFEKTLSEYITQALKEVYNAEVNSSQIVLQKTNVGFEGDITLVVFGLTRISKKSPEETGKTIGEFLKQNASLVKDFNVVKGFLNISIKEDSWLKEFENALAEKSFGITHAASTGDPVLVEYSSPNTNKPLHLGHIRNNLLGWSVAELLKSVGKKVMKVNIVNDRGIHICKSMIAWQKFGNGETPQSAGIKGDHLVGKYYVEFDKRYRIELESAFALSKNLIESLAQERKKYDFSAGQINYATKISILNILLYIKIDILSKQGELIFDDSAKSEFKKIQFDNWIKTVKLSDSVKANILKYYDFVWDKLKIIDFSKYDLSDLSKFYVELLKETSPILFETQEMLRKWEAHDRETIELWKKMNGWVYEGFDVTYKMLGVDFDKIYYESETYLLGKKIVEEGIAKKVFYKKPDGSVWIDLTDDGLDEKLVMRADGTSVYITQDLGTAVQRYEEYNFNKLIYVVGNEQEYHFRVLKLIMKKLGYSWAEHLYHLSYAMVDLPSGKMKSREGTVVDADDLVSEMISEAEKKTKELGKIEDFNSEEAKELYKTLGLGALKYFILKVDPEKRMLFNPEESIDLNGNTGPFIQYTYARIRSVIRKALTVGETKDFSNYNVSSYKQMNAKEKDLAMLLVNFPFIVAEAAQRYSPAVVANYVFEVSKSFNQFYHEYPIVDIQHEETSVFRLQLSSLASGVIKNSMHLLGIDVPERM